MQCPKCNHENKAGRKFCSKCGTSLENVCQKCGYKNEPDDEFCGECGAKLGESSPKTLETIIPTLEKIHSESKNWIPDALAQKYLAAEQQITGENRPITALFADISGSTQLASTRTSEAMFQLVQDCFRELVGIVARYEGSISGFRGDGLLALFGAPILHENDTERAILAAIDMREAMKDHQLQVSIGINTAMMTVGEIETDLHKEYTAYGADINLAKRLQEYAKPGQILVGTGTYRLTRRAFDYEVLTSLELKGFSQPVTAYLLEKPKPHPEKLRGIEGLRARMVGRDREFEDLLDSTESWLAGRGQIVTIIGEAGIGKSRLVKELKEYLGKEKAGEPEYRKAGEQESQKAGILVMEGRCVSIGQPISYWPFLDILRSWFDLAEDDSEEEVVDKVKGKISSLMPESVDDMLPFLGHLMNLRFGGEIDERLRHYSPEQIKHGIMMRLRDIFVALSQGNRLMLILEDLHWADELSLDLISLLMDELMAHPLMLVCMYRPEQGHNVYRLSNTAQRKCLDRYRKIELAKLSSGESRRLVSELLAIDNLPDNVRDMILSKSEGNPFFIEEVIRSLMERGLVYKENDRWIARDDIIEMQVPDTIQSVVLERVDRLESEAKYVLQCASVIGRLFKHSLLEHVTQKQRELDNYLDQFEERDLVYPERTLPEMEYAFKHALTQEATYQGILGQRRQAFHRNVALGIERLYKERIEEFYEELAYHWEHSGDKEKTLEYLIKAGEKAARKYLNDAAIDYYTQALNLAKEMNILGDRLGEIYEGRGEVNFNIGFYEEAISDMMEAVKLYTQRNNLASMYERISRVYNFHIYDLYEAAIYSYKALAEFEAKDKSRETSCFCSALALTQLFVGNKKEGERLLREAIVISEEMGYKELLGHQYATLFWMHAPFLLPDDSELQTVWEKALFYLPYCKSNLVNYSVACLQLGWTAKVYYEHVADNLDQIIYLIRESLDSGIKSGNAFTSVICAVTLYNHYENQGESKKALQDCELAWQLAIKTRFIYQEFMDHLLYGLMKLYTSEGEWPRLLDMMLQLVGSTLVLHRKAQVHPTVQHRWNRIVDKAYIKLHNVSPDIYENLRDELIIRLRESSESGERFFYHGQLMSLALLDGHRSDAETHAGEMMKLYSEAGSFPKRLSSKMRWAVELLSASEDKKTAVVSKLLKQIDDSMTFHEAMDVLEWLQWEDKIEKIIEWDQFDHIIMKFLQSVLEQDILQALRLIYHFYKRFGRDKELNDMVNSIWDTIPDVLKVEGVTHLLPEYVESCLIGTTEFATQFNHDPVESGWEWVNPAVDCTYSISGKGIEIVVPSNHDILRDKLDGPRILREICGDFIAEAHIQDGSSGKKHGGLFIWKDKNNYIRLEIPSKGDYEGTVYMGANVSGNFIHPGIHSFRDDKAWLRIERRGDRFTGYFSKDGENWYVCGWLDMPVEKTIKVGIHALCPEQPTTSTRFEYFKIYRHL